MSALDKERADLAKAERDIVEGERRVAEQLLLIERLGQSGHDTRGAELLLENYRQTLEQWHVHRQLILYAIERLEASDL